MRVRRAILPDDRAAITEMVTRAADRDGYSPLSEEARVVFDRGDGDAGWVAEGIDRIEGFAHRRVHRGSIVMEVAVAGDDPRTVAERLMAGIRDGQSGERMRIWASDPDTAAAVEDAGGVVGRRLIRMQRPLPAGTPERGEGIRIAPFRLSLDEGAYLIVANDAFAGHPESSGWSMATFAERAARPWFDGNGLFLAWDSGRPVGACWTKLHSGGVGEIYSIAVRPSASGRGLGRALVLTGLEYLADRRGAGIGMLWADRSNEAAVRLYGRLGMESVRERTELLLEV